MRVRAAGVGAVLLVAELRKLVRPLVWGTGLAAIAFLLLLTVGATSNAASGLKSPRIPSACGGAVSTLSPACVQEVTQAKEAAANDARQEHRQEMPGAVGEVAVGMLASLPGVFLIALIAGAHVGGEWSGRTIRTVLTHDGRRLRVLAAKWVSLWIGTVVTVLAAWVVLAVAGPLLAAAYGLPAAGQGLFAGLGASLAFLGRALLVLGVFTLVGVAAGLLTRSTVGTVAVVVGAIGALLIVGAVQGVAKLSPATWVQAWMHFSFNGAYLPTNFWTRFESGVTMSSGAAFIGLLGTLAVIGALAAWRAGADVTV
ncbi:MAG: hypothetical protein ACRDJU_04115 [Actinomycetota bacterium]